MGKININYTNGAIGGVLPSSDFISSFIFDSTVLPTGFTSTDRIKTIYSIKDAIDLGITGNSTDETKASGGDINITAIGAVGDYIKVYVTPVNGVKLFLGSYTVKTGDSISNVEDGLIANINLNTAITQWSAISVGSPDSITLVPKSGLGESINGSGVITTESKTGTTFTKTITDFSGGVGSQIDIIYYILDSYFKANSQSKVYVGIYDFTSAFDASKIATVQTKSGGEIRQMGVWLKKGLDGVVSIVNNAQASITDQTIKHKPLSIVIALQPGSITSASDLINIRSLSASQVSVTTSNVYGTSNKGYNLVGTTGYYPTDLGEALGHISRSKVSNSIAWVERNITQNDDVMLVTGETWLDIEDTTLATELFNKGYIFERQYLGLTGCYFENASVCDSFVSDYDSIQRRRTIDKAARVSYTTLLPFLSSPVLLDPASGNLSTSSIITFTAALNTQFDAMQSAIEISGYNVTIDPKQNLLVTKNLEITVVIVPVGTADQITVNLGFALSIQ